MVSIEVKFNEALEALDKVGKRAKFGEKLDALKQKSAGKIVPIEVQLNAAEAVLKESRVIRKHNGSAQLFVEGSPFNGELSESYVQETTDKFAGGDKIINESLGLSAEEQRVLAGQPPAEYASLSEAQKRDFDFARLIGISEADALKLTKITRNR